MLAPQASSPCTACLVHCSTLRVASLIVCAYSNSTLLTSLALLATQSARFARDIAGPLFVASSCTVALATLGDIADLHWIDHPLTLPIS